MGFNDASPVPVGFCLRPDNAEHSIDSVQHHHRVFRVTVPRRDRNFCPSQGTNGWTEPKQMLCFIEQIRLTVRVADDDSPARRFIR